MMALLRTPHVGFRWKRKQGEPESKAESMAQFIWLHRIFIYIAVVCTLTFIFQVLNLQPLGGLLD